MSKSEQLEIIYLKLNHYRMLLNLYLNRAKTINSIDYEIKYYNTACQILGKIIELKELEKRCLEK